jgi:5'-nucleotidase
MEKGVFKMTADAKVGLLLGLFFIVVIAFLVNGLPAYIQEENPLPTDVSIVTTPGQDIVLDNNLHEATHRLFPERTAQNQRVVQPPQEVVVLDSTQEVSSQVEVPDLLPQPQEPAVVYNTTTTAPQEKTITPKVQIHVVESGQTLPVIAKQYYGQDEGNRLVVIQKLFEVNNDVLKSADRICVGDKLTIPSPKEMDQLVNPSTQVVKAPSASERLMQKASHILDWADKKDTRSVSEYTVQEGDSLWSIAEVSLGNGNRYKEIAKLNESRIRNANNLAVGTRLAIPPQ